MRKIGNPPEIATPYEGYDVLEKWSSPSFDDQTRDALAQRLGEIPPRRFFSREELSTLEAIVERLAPPLPGLEASLLSLWIDDRLHRGSDEGFRSEGAPPAHEAWQRGLAAIEGEARRLFGASFATLDAPSKEAALHAVQAGETDEGLWDGLGAASFFSDTLLKTIAGLAYAHPLAWNDIGFGGPASPRGYVRLGFDARDPWEAKKRR